MLYIVSTPIGNLKDITLRALETLKAVDLIAAEDTRHTKILLDAYGIQKPLTSFFEHNEDRKTDELLGMLKAGKSIALVSDAGTPGISDPGYPLISRAKEEGVPMEIIPGPCALIAALTASGFPAHQFSFEGFLPVKSAGRRAKLKEFKGRRGTVIFYESPHRVLKTLADIVDVLDNPRVACARELTKKFEDVRHGPAADILNHFSRHAPRGEFVLLITL